MKPALASLLLMASGVVLALSGMPQLRPVTFYWVAPVAREDGTPLADGDIAWYEATTDGGLTAIVLSRLPSWTRLVPAGESVTAQFRTVLTDGQVSAWSAPCTKDGIVRGCL